MASKHDELDVNQQKEMREYAWQYFIAHAEARLTTFRFYLVFCTILAAGMITIVRYAPDARTGVPFGLLLSFFSFVYWKVDVRHKQIIKHAEAALEHLEEMFPVEDSDRGPHVLKLFLGEKHRSAALKRFPKQFSPRAHFSYSTCVNMVFLVFGASGIVATLTLLLG